MPDNPVADDRLDSWKEIATYLRRDITTVQRWEKREGMPVHRHLHDKLGSVYAFRAELEAWSRTRKFSSQESWKDTTSESLPVTRQRFAIPKRKLLALALIAVAL